MSRRSSEDVTLATVKLRSKAWVRDLLVVIAAIMAMVGVPVAGFFALQIYFCHEHSPAATWAQCVRHPW